MPIQKTCELCGKLFKVPPSDSKQRFCSAECGNRSRRKVTEYTCKTCGETFTRKGSRKEGVKYCSEECRNIGMQNRTVKYCAVCGKPVERAKSLNEQGENVICSAECKSKFFSELYKGENHPRYNSIKKECAICGKIFDVPVSVDMNKNIHVCSRECRRIYEKKHPRSWEENHERQYWISQREKALERDNNTCQICGATENLEVHHKEKRRMFNGDYIKMHDIDNLLTVCHTCHLSIEPRKPIPTRQYRDNQPDSE